MTIRFKLTMVIIAVILVANSLLSLFTMRYVGRVWLQEVQARVRRNLNSARAAYNSHIEGIARFLEAASLDERITSALAAGDDEALGRLLDAAFHRGGMDILLALSPRGEVRYRAQNPGRRGDDLSGNPVAARAIASKRHSTGTIVLSREALETEGHDLAQRAEIALLETPKARPTPEKTRKAGMVTAAAVPMLGPDGALVGVLYAGDLLNCRYEIVDAIRDQVFAHQAYRGKEMGTATLFLGDLRIATNVMTEDGERAVGTRLSAEVCEKVLDAGQTWDDRAFVVNDWYLSAYEPIRDPTSRIIGVLYVGLLEAPFAQRENVITGVFLGMVTGTTAASLLLIVLVTKLVLRPIGRIIGMSRRVIEGDLSARVRIHPRGEMGVLCQAVDAMADALAQREEQLKQATRRQIGRSEQLASVGRLAAGVAHEINNPLTGVLTFSHLLRQKPNMDEQDQQDLDVIITETTRVGKIVRGLLDFARETPAVKEPLDVNDVIRRTIALIRNQTQFVQIAIEADLKEDVPVVHGDPNQLQQVLLNLSLNACEAMPKGGRLTFSTAGRDGKVLVKVADTGCGIPPEHLDEIFEPFFSTKPVGKGTGLGLSVSYGIVQQHGGTLEVESRVGTGTTFTMALPGGDKHAATGGERRVRT